MIEDEPGNQRREVSPLPEKNESKHPEKQRKSKPATKQEVRAAAAASNESDADLENGKTREYSADDLNEAVIWVRNFDPNDTSVKPLINTAQYKSEQKAAAKSRALKKSDTESGISKNSNSRNSVTRKIEHYDARPASELADADLQGEYYDPNGTPERNYFWNQLDVFPPNDHDVLPAITDVENQALENGSVIEQADAVSANDSSLAEAVNPNDPAYSDHAPRVHPNKAAAKQAKKPKSGFMARRREKRAVQSQQMEAETFDRMAPASPYNELVPDEAGKYTDAQAAFEQPVVADEYNDAPYAAERSDADAQSPLTSTYPEVSVSSHKEKVEASYGEQDKDQPAVELSLERSEQLDLARSINIDGVSVYEMFTAGRIDDAGLNRIIKEFLRGGDLRDVIKSEIIRQQLKFERDPRLRDTPVGKKAAVKGKTSRLKTRTKSIVKPAHNRDRTEKLAVFTQNAVEKTHEYLDGNPKAGQMMSIAAIVVIYLAILIVAIAK